MDKKQEGIRSYAKDKIKQFFLWMKPVPGDPFLITLIKSIYKFIALLVVIALSPVIIIVLIFVFLAAI